MPVRKPRFPLMMPLEFSDIEQYRMVRAWILFTVIQHSVGQRGEGTMGMIVFGTMMEGRSLKQDKTV